VLHGDANWRNLADATEPSMCGSDAVFLSYYFDQLLLLGLMVVLLTGLCGLLLHIEFCGLSVCLSVDLHIVGLKITKNISVKLK